MKLIKTLMFTSAFFVAAGSFASAEELKDELGSQAEFQSLKAGGVTRDDTSFERLRAILSRAADGAQTIGGVAANGAIADGNRATVLDHADGSDGAAGGAGQNAVALPDVSAAKNLADLVALINAAVDD